MVTGPKQPKGARKAYSYLRFSTPEQMHGDSFRRQTRMTEEYAAKHNLILDDKLTYKDLGVSAYRGANAATGRLADFLEAVREGAVPKGSVLLVESLDRISRQTARKAVRVLEDIVDGGVTVVTLSDQKEYDKRSLDEDPMSLMFALMIFIRANEESANKARRLRAAWEGKRINIKDKPLTARVPAWLTLDRDTGRIVADKSRARVVRRIYEMTLDGKGQHAIALTLNREKVPTFGGAKMWHRSYVKKILENPAVIGTLIPHRLDYSDGMKKRVALEQVEGYYPAVVERELYERVHSMRQGNKAPGRRGRKGKLNNLLAGLARCPVCGATMTRVSKGSGEKAGKPYLVCTRAKAGLEKHYRAIPQEQVEGALIGNASVIVGTAPSENASLDGQFDKVETTLDAVNDAIENVVKALRKGPSRALNDELRALEQEKVRLEGERTAIGAQVAAASGPVLVKKLNELEEALTAKRVDRAHTNALLRQLLTSVEVDWITGRLVFNWKQGSQTALQFMWPAEV